MIVEERLSGVLDQIDGVVWFDKKESESSVYDICYGLDSICEALKIRYILLIIESDNIRESVWYKQFV